MKLKTFLLILIVICLHNITIANAVKSNYYFVSGKDTTFCKSLTYSETGQGYLSKIEYVDMDGKEIELKKKTLPDVETFYLNGVIFDKLPQKADKPNGYIRYTQRVVDGKLKVYLEGQGTYTRTNISTGQSSTGSYGSYRFFIKMPDGKLYKINKSANMKNVIIPYLEKCAEFKKQYKGDYSDKEEPFMKTIKLYNSLCE